jgi:hypothetical protein
MGAGGNEGLSQWCVRHKQYANHILKPPVSADVFSRRPAQLLIF